MRRWLVLIAACGGTPAPQPVIANKPPIELTTCKDASVLLRGPIESEDLKAGPAREDAILRACTDDHWSAAVLACIGSTRTPRECVTRLDGQQQDNYLAKIGTWEAEYAGGDDPPPPPADKYTDCSELVTDTSRYAPPFDTEREWQAPQRAKLIEEQCRAGDWSEETKACLLVAADIAGTTACIQLDPSLVKLTQQLTDLDGVAQKIAAAKKKPATIACAKAVAVHYADAKWKTPTKDKGTSRTAMQKACAAEKWSETQRACIVTADAPSCYDNPIVWSYPALPMTKQGNMPTECLVYVAVIKRVTECQSLPQASRDAMKQALSTLDQAWANVSADDAKTMGPLCKSGADSMQTSFPSCNGW